MDSVNLLYVAFTRAVDRLCFMGVHSSYGGKLQKDVFNALANLYPEFVDGNRIKGVVGQKPAVSAEEEAPDLAFTPRSLNNYLWFPDISIMSEAEQDENDLHRQQRLGKQFHAVMEHSFTLEDAFSAIQKGILKGTIESALKEDLQTYAERLFGNEEYASLVRNGVQLDERTLLIDGTMKLRPDKIILHLDRTVVIDFKTGERKPEHLKQVSDYVFALNMIGYPEIEGFLYYLGENKIVKVRSGIL
jgi:ATP-dependent exoDNAse (exonuclease V) beta subunit